MKKKVLIIIGVILILAVSAPCLYFIGGLILREAYYVKDVTSWRDKTTPIAVDVVQDMCKKLEIPRTDWRCKQGATVYAPDFFKEINEHFTPTKNKIITIEEFNKTFGVYLYDVEPMIKESNGFEYYRCWYDLNTDHINHFVVYVDKNGKIFRLIATVVH